MGIRGLGGWVCAAVALLCSSCGGAGYLKPVTLQVDLEAGTYLLANGMRVVLQHDADTPFVHARVTYEAGSGEEDIQKTGLAHLAEHITYRARAGSTTIHAYEQEITSGEMNGETGPRSTSYHGTMLPSQLGRFLWAEARRMAFPLEGVNDATFRTERAVVLQELAQRYGNRPYGFAYFAALGALFPEGHPDRHPTVGYAEHLQRETLADVRSFTTRYYGPDNAILVVSGNFDTDVVVRDIDRYFGPLQASHATRRRTPPALIPGGRMVKMATGEAQGATYLAFPGPPTWDEGWACMVVLEYLLGEAVAYDLYKEKMRYDSDLWPMHDASVLFVSVVAAPGEDLAALDRRIVDAMAEVAQSVASNPRRLANARSALLMRHVLPIENLDERGDRIARHMQDAAEPDLTQRELRAIQGVTAEKLEEFVGAMRQTYVAVHLVPTAGAPRAGEVIP